ncbi:hypothetical protein ACFXTH_011713 [Malus domestica]
MAANRVEMEESWVREEEKVKSRALQTRCVKLSDASNKLGKKFATGASVVKRTSAKDVKAALIDSNWDIEAAQKELRRREKVLASKKSSRMAAKGLLALAQN